MQRVFAVVPTYRPEPDVLERLDLLSPQVDAVIVVDDGSPASSDSVLASIEARGYVVLRQGVNTGIAAALNRGASLALDQGADFVLTLDQDTVVPADYVAVALSVFATATPATRLGVVASDLVNGHPAIPPRRSPEGLGLVGEAIQSGMVISAECLREGGPFDESYFIDCVDTEYCVRIVQRGFRISIAKGTNLLHALGQQVPKRPFGFPLMNDGAPVLYQYHSPYRRYFITRNNIDMWFRFARSQPRWVLAVIRREVPTGLIIAVSGPRRIKQAIALVAGTFDGLARRLGPMPDRLRRLLG
ncbi:glycosyltransferase [Glaciibacter flavus]|uniref:glycosyltransferase n=1 Tax=Orlajensenia flava TaxID=2565934 RepID=UPI003AFFF307